MSFWKVDLSNDLVKRSVRLYMERIWLTSMFWYCCCLWELQCYVLGVVSLMYPFFNRSIHAALSSKIVVGRSTTEIRPLVLRICSVTAFNQKHSCDASCRARISAWFEQVTISVFLVDLQVIRCLKRWRHSLFENMPYVGQTDIQHLRNQHAGINPMTEGAAATLEDLWG